MSNQEKAIAVVERLNDEYERAVDALRTALRAYLENGTRPDPQTRFDGTFAYPELRLTYDPEALPPKLARSYARVSRPGVYATTVTKPAQFKDYLVEQLSLLMDDFDVEIEVERSRQEIPYPYVLDASIDLNQADVRSEDIARFFPTTDLAFIGDEIADGVWNPALEETRPLSLFDGLRTDFSLARLKHYTGAPAEDVQQFILFTNYHRYVDEFVRWGIEQLRQPDSPYTALSCSGGLTITATTANPEMAVAESTWRKHQMPAYHLMAPGGAGVTLVNIGVGPSNAKTICDHLAVLRPQAWLMIGHCGGLRDTQTIGDYVLAHAYLRDDHVLDDVLPPEIPVPSIAEVQRALYDAAKAISGDSGDQLKKRLRTGELRHSLSALRFNQSRAVAIDMESATISAQGYRFRVPYGTLLCVSDKPLHGEIKLPGQANAFYERAISQHLQIGILTCKLLHAEGPNLHSRKLRAFDEPPFR
jgi:AMP nucleosidase